MNRIIKAFRVFTLIFFASTLWSTSCFAVTPEQIFIWVSRHMHIEYADNMPEVKYVEKQELQQIFQVSSRNSLEKWRKDHGEKEAGIIMANYLDRVLGLFIPETQIIYVGNHLPPCEQQSILAHEITHYFQNLRDGPITLGKYGAEDRIMFREMEAYQIASKFKELFCGSPDHAKKILSLFYTR